MSFSDHPVHLRVYAGEPYIDRAVDTDPHNLPFNSVWVGSKYYYKGDRPSIEEGPKVAARMEEVVDKLKMPATPGYGLHPIDWLSTEHWAARAKSLDDFITSGGFEGMPISIDIEGYGYVTEGVRTRTPPPSSEGSWEALVTAAAPVRHVLLKHRMKPTIYPCGGRKFEAYTRAALALGATTFADEYSFVFAGKLKNNETIDREGLQFWQKYFSEEDPTDIGVRRFPGLLTSNFRAGSPDTAALKFMNIKECWLFVDRRDFLLPPDAAAAMDASELENDEKSIIEDPSLP